MVHNLTPCNVTKQFEREEWTHSPHKELNTGVVRGYIELTCPKCGIKKEYPAGEETRAYFVCNGIVILQSSQLPENDETAWIIKGTVQPKP